MLFVGREGKTSENGMPYYRMYGSVSREIDVWTNYAGKDNIVITHITSAERASLGAPGEVETYALCDGVEPLAWNPATSQWENFYTVLGIPISAGPKGEDGVSPVLSIGTVSSGSPAACTMTGTSSAPVLNLTIPPGTNGTNGTNGANGANNTLAIGTVTQGTAAATITGTSPNQTLNLVLPKGDAGPANTLSIGTVSTLAVGASATVSITGTAPAQTLNLGIPVGATGAAGTNGANGVGISPSTPVAMTVVIGTAYQAPDPTKAAHINLMLESNYVTTLAGTSADELEVRIGPTNAVTGASGGTQAATWKTSLTGIALTVGLGLIQRNPVPIMLPVGWYFCVRRLSGTAAIISSTVAQPLG